MYSLEDISNAKEAFLSVAQLIVAFLLFAIRAVTQEHELFFPRAVFSLTVGQARLVEGTVQ